MASTKKIIGYTLASCLLAGSLHSEENQIPVVKQEATTAQQETAQFNVLEQLLASLAANSTKRTTQATHRSLLDEKPDYFCRSHICVIDTVGDPDSTHVRFFNPDLATILSFKVAKDKKLNRGIWKQCNVLRRTKRIYSGGIKFDSKFEGYRETFLGILFEHILGLTEHYRGTLFIDEYKNYPLWNVVLKDREELLEFLGYFAQNLQQRGKNQFDNKPVLLLTLKDDLTLSSLEEKDFQLISTLFELVSPSDKTTTKFFTDTQITMDDLIMRFESGHPIYLGENVRKQIFRSVEKTFAEFKMQDMIPKALSYGFGTFVLALAVSEASNYLRSKLHPAKA